MSLYDELKLYLRKQSRLTDRANYINTELVHGWMKIYATESLISETWQLWNIVCKKILVKSCQGCAGRCGNIYNARCTDNSLERITYEVRQYANGCKVEPQGAIFCFWEYPTWGDGNKMIRVITGLHPSNENILVTAFGLPLFGHKHLQKLRNYLFHKDQDALIALKKNLPPSRSVSKTHPAYYIWEYSTANNSLYYFDWVNDMKNIIYQATV